MSEFKKEKSYAFFDVDDTLISIKSMFDFQEYWFSRYPNKVAQDCFDRDMERRNEKDISWAFLNKLYYSHFEGRDVATLEQCAQDWFDDLERNNDNLFYNAIVELLRQHQQQQCEVVFVSGSFQAVLMPIAKRLDVRTILATKMEVESGCFTGKILAPQTIGEGKAEAIKTFLNEVGGDASVCYAYGDDISDLPMLKSVGYPRVVSGGRGLEDYAKKVGWPILASV